MKMPAELRPVFPGGNWGQVSPAQGGHFTGWPTENTNKLTNPVDIPPRRRELRPLVILFMGRRYQGKTVSMTYTGLIQHLRYQAVKSPMRVFSNYKVSFAYNKAEKGAPWGGDPYLLDKLMEFPVWAHDCYILVDEIGSAFPGRRSLASPNVLAAQLLTQIRKRDMELCFTTQFPQTLDQQVIQQIDLFVMCEQFHYRKNGQWRQGIELKVWDYWGQYTGDMRRKWWPPYYEPFDWQMTYYNTDIVWPMFNTKEVISPLWSKARENIIAQQWDISREELDQGAEKFFTSPQRVSYPDLKLPQTMEEILATQKGPFNIMAIMEDAKRLVPTIKSKVSLREYLQAQGFKVDSERGSMVATRA